MKKNILVAVFALAAFCRPVMAQQPIVPARCPVLTQDGISPIGVDHPTGCKIHKKPERHLTWAPQPTITMQEMTQAQPFIQMLSNSFPREYNPVFDKLPPEVQRHFTAETKEP